MDANTLSVMAICATPSKLYEQLMSNSVMVGGGYLRFLAEVGFGEMPEPFQPLKDRILSGRRVPDIDVFGHNEWTMLRLANELAQERGTTFTSTDNAITVPGVDNMTIWDRLPVQYVTRGEYRTPEELVNSFDFTCCQATFYSHIQFPLSRRDDRPNSDSCVLVGDEFFEHVAERRMVYTGASGTVSGTLMRVLKYAAKGYSIEASEYAAIIARFVREVDPDSTELQEDQLHERAAERLTNYRAYDY